METNECSCGAWQFEGCFCGLTHGQFLASTRNPYLNAGDPIWGQRSSRQDLHEPDEPTEPGK